MAAVDQGHCVHGHSRSRVAHGCNRPHRHPTRAMSAAELFQGNAMRGKNAAWMSQQVRIGRLESRHCERGDPDYSWKSHATNFARGGVDFRGRSYIRDPRTGVWFSTERQEFPGLKAPVVKPYVLPRDGDRPHSAPCGNEIGRRIAAMEQQQQMSLPDQQAPLQQTQQRARARSAPGGPGDGRFNDSLNNSFSVRRYGSIRRGDILRAAVIGVDP
eukprot:TRINITY_DN73710_c0_g1_i1.p1 TRINITY_DN73710_c0_g1~~TRINITY_DN73710_c0_g1_i1.p1  ORF type:complete len:237 (+),score=19.00 TRINITY_DN73710_c0_g1_i1:67-711(+)